MQRFKRFSINHPVLFGVVLFFLYSLLSTLVWPITQLYPYPDGYELSFALSKLIIAACFFMIIWRFGWIQLTGYTNWGASKTWRWVLFMMAYKTVLVFFLFGGGLQFNLPDLGFGLAIGFYCLATSLLEETLYRGLLLTGMVESWGHTRRGLFASAVVSGLFFASLHIFNVIIRPLPVVMFQILSMVMVGFYYAALRLSGKSIWPVVVFHAMVNLAANLAVIQNPAFNENIQHWILYTLISLPLLLIGIYLLGKVPLHEAAGKSVPGVEKLSSPKLAANQAH